MVATIRYGKEDQHKREGLLVAVHFTNLQPLWAEENLKKRDKPQLEE